MSKRPSDTAVQLAKAKLLVEAESEKSELRSKIALDKLRELEAERYATYYESRHGESLTETITKAKRGCHNSILQLIEWSKLYLSEYYVVAQIKRAEVDLTHLIGHNSYLNIAAIRKNAKRFLSRVGKSVTKVSQLPKIKKYWDLLDYLRRHAHEHTISSLADFARQNTAAFPANSPEEELLTSKKTVLTRFIRTHRHFIGVADKGNK